MKISNQSSDQWCKACGNLGWVTLKGSVMDGGRRYERGATPCRWCEMGTAAFLPFAGRSDRDRPVSNYDERDIEVVGPRDVVPVSAVKQRAYVETVKAAIRAMEARSREVKHGAIRERRNGDLVFNEAEKRLINDRIVQASMALAEARSEDRRVGGGEPDGRVA